MERILSAYEFTLEVAARGVHAKKPIKVRGCWLLRWRT